MPSRQQLRWAQLRVGLTVIFASVVLALVIFLVSGTGGIFSSKISIYAYFENASQIRVGAPVRLEGVDIGNVTGVDIVPREQQPPLSRTTPQKYVEQVRNEVIDKPVRIKMTVVTSKVSHVKNDSIAELKTAGVLGETFVDIDATGATGGAVTNGDVLKTRPMRSMDTMISAGQSAVENMNNLILRFDRIVAGLENGQGTAGKLLTDETLYNRLNSTLAQFQNVATQITNGQGSIAKLLNSDELYNKINSDVDKLGQVIDDVNAGKGSLGKFMKDETLYDNANKTIQSANQLIADINAGKGALGKLAKDEQMAKKLDNIVTKLSAISDQLAAGQGTAGRLLQDPKLYDSADQALVELRNLTKAIRENPKKYLTIHFRVF